MDLDANVLTLLIILGVVMWKARVILRDLETRADHQLHRPILGPAEPDGRGNPSDAQKHRPSGGPDLSVAAAHGLDDIRLGDRSFNADHFLDSVRLVYEAVVLAFANGDRNVLRNLLSTDVYETFSQEIAAREGRREQVELSFIGVKRAEIVDASVFNEQMQVIVDLESEFVTATRDEAGRIVAGDPTRIITASDRWTFAKERTSRSPTWKLAATESPPADDHAAIPSEQA
jgi:predicted lipid-binding transport protein (Tim44 family)